MKYADVKGFAALLHVSESTVRRLIRKGLPVLRVGVSVRVDVAAAETWIKDGGGGLRAAEAVLH